MEYRKEVLKVILDEIQQNPNVLAAWEGGSAATGTQDQYSDIDLCILAKKPLQDVLDQVEKSLQKFQVIHTWQAAKSFWGEGLMQRVMVLKDSPKYFSVDAGVFDEAQPQLLKDFLEVERHGQPIIYFDKVNAIQTGHTDEKSLYKKQLLRAYELNQGFTIFKSLVLKEIDRGNAIDAVSFYQNGLLRPMVEVMGMIYRPFKYDFGMRYIHKHFPADKQKLIEDLSYVKDMHELKGKVLKLETAFNEAVSQVKDKLEGSAL